MSENTVGTVIAPDEFTPVEKMTDRQLLEEIVMNMRNVAEGLATLNAAAAKNPLLRTMFGL